MALRSNNYSGTKPADKNPSDTSTFNKLMDPKAEENPENLKGSDDMSRSVAKGGKPSEPFGLPKKNNPF